MKLLKRHLVFLHLTFVFLFNIQFCRGIAGAREFSTNTEDRSATHASVYLDAGKDNDENADFLASILISLRSSTNFTAQNQDGPGPTNLILDFQNLPRVYPTGGGAFIFSLFLLFRNNFCI